MAQREARRLYRKLPIPPDQECVRLLHVDQPSNPKNLHETIQCSLTVEKLHEKQYAALSYVWGKTTDPPHTIECSGIQIPVGAECLSALQRLRAKLGGFTIWIDAICIDQENDEEKAQQIPMMKDIYMTAHTTYIWLGEGDDMKDRAMEYLSGAGLLEYYHHADEEAGSSIQPRPWAAALHFVRNRMVFGRSLVPVKKTGPRSCRMPSRQTKLDPTFHDLETLLNCTWITRIWTYQEAALSRNPVICCGAAQIPWKRFAHCMVFLRTATQMEAKHVRPWLETIATRATCQAKINNQELSLEALDQYRGFCKAVWTIRIGVAACVLIPPAVLFIVGIAMSIALPMILESRSLASVFWLEAVPWLIAWLACVLTAVRLYLPRTVRPTIPEFLGSKGRDSLLDTLSSRSASNPKDMSFALQTILELSTDSKMVVPDVDYSLSKSDVYQTLTRYLLNSDDQLRVLLLAASSQCADAPSWVPDYGQRLKRLEEVYDLETNLNDCSKGARANFRLETHSSTLVTKGFHVETVAQVTHFQRATQQKPEPDFASHRQNLELLLEWCCYNVMRRKRPKSALFVSLYPFARQRQLEISDAHTGGPVPFFENIIFSACPSIARPTMETYLETISSVSSVAVQIPKGFGARTVWTRLKRKKLLEIHFRVVDALARANFVVFKTRTGYPGFGFGAFRRDDEVYIVAGLPVPLVMRRNGAALRLVSTCHIACSCVRMRDVRPPSCFHSGNAWNHYLQLHVERCNLDPSVEGDSKVPHTCLQRGCSMPNVYSESKCYYVEQRRVRLNQRVVAMMQNEAPDYSFTQEAHVEETLPDVCIS